MADSSSSALSETSRAKMNSGNPRNGTRLTNCDGVTGIPYLVFPKIVSPSIYSGCGGLLVFGSNGSLTKTCGLLPSVENHFEIEDE